MPSSPMLRTTRTAILALVLLLTALAYAPGLRGEFVLDDKLTVESNLEIRDLGPFFHLAPWSGIVRADRTLTNLTFALNYATGKLDPLPYHVTNLAIHLGVVLLVYVFVRRLLLLCGLAERAHLALAVAALFALHPLQTQAVVYVSQRAESLASAFYIGALLLLLEAERRGRTRTGITLYILAFTCHVLGLGTKSIVLTVPFTYLLMGVLPARAEDKSPLARPILRLALSVPFVGYSAFVGFQSVPALRNSVQGLIVAGFDIPSLSPWHYFLTQWEVVVTYLRLLFWPAGQNLDWNFPVAHGLGDPSVSLCGSLLSALLLGSGYVLYRYRARGDRTGSV